MSNQIVMFYEKFVEAEEFGFSSGFRYGVMFMSGLLKGGAES